MLQLFTCRATSTWLGNVQGDLGNTGRDFTLLLSVILHPDSFKICQSQTSLKSEMATFSKATCSNFLEMPQAFCPLSIAWLHLKPSLFLQRFSSAHLQLCRAPPGKEYIYSKCKDKYLPEFICNSTTGKLFKNNNNNNNKESSQEIKERLIPLPGLIYFYTSNNKEIGNELHLLSSIQWC